MQNRTLGMVLLALGLVLTLLALFADSIFSGAGKNAGFGSQQMLALIVGLGVVVAGGLLARKR